MQLIQTLLAGEKSIVELNRQQALEALEHALALLVRQQESVPQVVITRRPEAGALPEELQL